MQAAFETQGRLQDLYRQLTNCKGQIFQRDRERRMADLTEKELQGLKAENEGIVTYKAVGKM
jgi:hypothetical protein